jgi:hypothetical protein
MEHDVEDMDLATLVALVRDEREPRTLEGRGYLFKFYRKAALRLADEVEHLERAPRNLLARIHRDGGHHDEKVGREQSCIDAEAKVCALIEAIARCPPHFDDCALVQDPSNGSPCTCRELRDALRPHLGALEMLKQRSEEEK